MDIIVKCIIAEFSARVSFTVNYPRNRMGCLCVDSDSDLNTAAHTATSIRRFKTAISRRRSQDGELNPAAQDGELKTRNGATNDERKVRRPGNGGWLLLFCAIAWMSGLSLAMASEYHGQVTFGGLPLPGSTVTVTATQGDKTAVAITDSQGFYSFATWPMEWTIAIEMTGLRR